MNNTTATKEHMKETSIAIEDLANLNMKKFTVCGPDLGACTAKAIQLANDAIVEANGRGNYVVETKFSWSLRQAGRSTPVGSVATVFFR
jgi:hypothetical protein